MSMDRKTLDDAARECRQRADAAVDKIERARRARAEYEQRIEREARAAYRAEDAAD